MEKLRSLFTGRRIFLYLLVPFMIAALSWAILSKTLPESRFVTDALESVENSNKTVSTFTAAVAAVSVAISALPDDIATPVANSFASLDKYFILILIIIFIERILLTSGVEIIFQFLIPAAVILWGSGRFLRVSPITVFSKKIMILALALFLVVPCSIHLTAYVGSDYLAYVDETIAEAGSSAEDITEKTQDEQDNTSWTEKLSGILQSAIDGVTSVVDFFEKLLTKCMNSIAILIVANFVMPLVTFFIFRWLLKELFSIHLPTEKIDAFIKKETFHKKRGGEDRL